MIVSVVTEADAGGDGDLRLLEELLRELDRALSTIALGDLRPDVHRGLRVLNGPSRLAQALHHHVAAALVLGANLLYAVLRAFERGDRGDLQRREGPVVVVALDARERVHELGIAD